MNKHDALACDQCGAALQAFQEGSCQGVRCLQCGWSAVTSCIEGIVLDETVYAVHVLNGCFQNVQHIRVIAGVASVNFLAAKDLLRQERPVVFEGAARDVKRVRDMLAAQGIDSMIRPDFNW